MSVKDFVFSAFFFRVSSCFSGICFNFVPVEPQGEIEKNDRKNNLQMEPHPSLSITGTSYDFS